ncbi:MAG TPA: HEXXH motif-containing putative peptide modification protein [Pseudonocardiaceae bacterium]|nr:HEXXH motif-containing putative peptide modification protein [Pseudonocardiaceae bacterium]
MTTPAVPVPCDIPALHAAIAPSSALREERRILYQLATDLLDRGCSRVLHDDIIDCPITRKQIGDALAGRSGLARSRLVGISALATADNAVHGVPVVSRPEANTLLADVLDYIGLELGRQRETSGRPRLLTEADGKSFTSAVAVLRDGAALARSISPELIDDLLAHVALIGILDPRQTGGLSSGSTRNCPGLILLESPHSSIGVAEALVHEGAHQKFFDLAITHDLLTIDSDRCEPFHPPWAPADRFWSAETALAACHAYACLARFALARPATQAIGPGSLLLVANKRRDTIGQWLLANGDYLGHDAHTLLTGLLGQPPRHTHIDEKLPDTLTADYVVDSRLVFRHCTASDRVLVGRASLPPQLYWVSADAAALLRLLRHTPPVEVIDTFAQRWQMTSLVARDRLSTVLHDLSVSGLVTTSL